MMASANRTRLVRIDFKRTISRSRLAVSRGFRDTAKEMSKAIKITLGKQGTALFRSMPGEPPRRQTGNLQGRTSVVNKGREIVIRTLQYGLFLDPHFEARGLSNRPYIKVTIHDKRRFWQRRINANIRKHAK